MLALTDHHSSVYSEFCCFLFPQPPPRRPAVYAEQHESDEEKQFRRVFQQLAGEVSAMTTFTPLRAFLLVHVSAASVVFTFC